MAIKVTTFTTYEQKLPFINTLYLFEQNGPKVKHRNKFYKIWHCKHIQYHRQTVKKKTHLKISSDNTTLHMIIITCLLCNSLYFFDIVFSDLLKSICKILQLMTLSNCWLEEITQ